MIEEEDLDPDRMIEEEEDQGRDLDLDRMKEEEEDGLDLMSIEIDREKECRLRILRREGFSEEDSR
jgi:hypothetical protein